MRILAAYLVFSAVGFGQSPEAKNCSVDGSVVNSVTGAPILRAHVSVAGAYFAESDASGKWTVEHVGCGLVTIEAERAGFLWARSSGQESLTPGIPLHDVKLELTPQAVLAGRVVDDQGDPIRGVQVMLMDSRVIEGLRGLQPRDLTGTNDLGEYRFAYLDGGKYILCARKERGPGADTSRPYGQKCYPGPVDTEPLSTMDVAAGYEGRIDFAISPVATVRVSGVVSGLPKSDPGVVTLKRPNDMSSDGIFAPVREDGTFLIGNVPPGSYVLTAGTSRDNQMTTRVPIEVGSGDIEGLRLHPEPGFQVTGTVRVVSAIGKKADKTQGSVILRSSSWMYPADQQIRWDDGKAAFTISDVQPDNYHLEFLPPELLYVKSATLGGQDMLVSEVRIGPGAGNIEVVISDDGGAVAGDVLAGDAPAAGWILLERDGKPLRNIRSDASGHFKIDTVPPGDYKIYAWDDNSNVEYANPEWMKRNGKGVAVTVAPGQTAQVKLARQIAPPE
jgi:hypothetical protein